MITVYTNIVFLSSTYSVLKNINCFSKDIADSAAPMPLASEKEQERRQERLRQGAKRALGDYSDYENKYWEKQGAGKQSNEPPKIK